ncbi:hypothetical protein IG193_04320 [Infirmifilum lucidum]|uniref:Uncharacterized protein n=1 Tax=Infirmifilum lucidum TaxID=2776706 RepID=A0A7L9FLG8_9CREN|nr:hypothetical protein [Infirmifilum lucidum]QOJ79685.1 hypothetical protein IG193_04320 [Infirmifilum lucidum]
MHRRAAASLVAVIVLSILVLNFVQHTHRARYIGEDVHALMLITVREACKSPEKAPTLFARVQGLLRYVAVKSLSISVPENRSEYSKGSLVCIGRVVTNLGEDVFALNYTYSLTGFFVEPLTGRIFRLYRVEGYQFFKIPPYNYTIRLRVGLTPICPHDHVNNSSILAIRGTDPCVLSDKWGIKLVIPGG